MICVGSLFLMFQIDIWPCLPLLQKSADLIDVSLLWTENYSANYQGEIPSSSQETQK